MIYGVLCCVSFVTMACCGLLSCYFDDKSEGHYSLKYNNLSYGFATAQRASVILMVIFYILFLIFG